MIKHFCDRCGKVMTEELYIVEIRRESLTALNERTDYQHWVQQSTSSVFGVDHTALHVPMPREYCKECINEMEAFMRICREKGGE